MRSRITLIVRRSALLLAPLVIALAIPGCSADADPSPASARDDSATPAPGPKADRAESPEGSAKSGSSLAAWGTVLKKYQKDGGLDYAALDKDRGDLDRFLKSLRGVDPSKMGDDERLAYWINAYNAVVVHHVLERYPGIESVKKVDGFFDGLTYPVAGQKMTLDQIEAKGKEIGDARIHFAVVCASTSCPDLRGEPYVAAKLDAQLEDQAKRFLADESKGARLEGDTLNLSSIFKWYAGDFTGGSTVAAFFSRSKVLGWVVEHAPEDLAAKIEKAEPSVSYMDYDWSLNDR